MYIICGYKVALVLLQLPAFIKNPYVNIEVDRKLTCRIGKYKKFDCYYCPGYPQDFYRIDEYDENGNSSETRMMTEAVADTSDINSYNYPESQDGIINSDSFKQLVEWYKSKFADKL